MTEDDGKYFSFIRQLFAAVVGTCGVVVDGGARDYAWHVAPAEGVRYCPAI